MSTGELLTSWTIRIALVAYFGGLAGLVLMRARPQFLQVTRLLWTAGCVFYLAHVVSAFEFYHEWSHQAAILDTAWQTHEVLGINVGNGIYMTYFFTLLWFLDVVWWWIVGHKRYAGRSKLVSSSIHIFMLFIIVNGAIVFEAGMARWFTAAALIILMALWLKHKRSFITQSV